MFVVNKQLLHWVSTSNLTYRSLRLVEPRNLPKSTIRANLFDSASDFGVPTEFLTIRKVFVFAFAYTIFSCYSKSIFIDFADDILTFQKFNWFPSEVKKQIELFQGVPYITIAKYSFVLAH